MKTEKKCIVCGELKSLSAFYKHKAMADGRLGKCSDCCKKQSKEREEKLRQNPEWVEKEKERARDKYHRLGYREKHKPTYEQKKSIMRRYSEKYPEKIKARIAINKMKCQTIGNQLHHWSYNKEHYKDVIELSVADHNLVHRNIIYDQERMMYRNLDGILLDSRESSIDYYKEIGVSCK